MAARRLLLQQDDHLNLEIYKKCFDCYTYSVNCSHECARKFTPLSNAQRYHMPPFFIFLLCLLAAVFVFLSYFSILKRYRKEGPPPPEPSREDFIDADQTPVDYPIWHIRTVGLPESVIESILVFSYKTGEGLTEGSDCSVCLTEFQEDESLRLLPKCSHAFHVSCIDTWLRSHKNCPMCRAPVVSEADAAVEHGEGDVGVAGDQETEAEDGPENHEEVNGGEVLSPMGTFEQRNRKGIRAQSDLAEHRVSLQPPRRAASMDSSSVSIICSSAAEAAPEMGSSKPSLSGSRSSSWYRAMKSSSFRRPLQTVRSSSSISCSEPIN
ncbi:unnamed protein product [Cuscuta epithymum]|uniref:RING-type E3 ubiquitin transferase n=1 Tax=Cuscuta epithymum TaxID=186058 RepID=A0AAV0C6R4_9ASTE|nr:unnamed protein product [Cuscuta epithymum]